MSRSIEAGGRLPPEALREQQTKAAQTAVAAIRETGNVPSGGTIFLAIHRLLGIPERNPRQALQLTGLYSKLEEEYGSSAQRVLQEWEGAAALRNDPRIKRIPPPQDHSIVIATEQGQYGHLLEHLLVQGGRILIRPALRPSSP